MKLRGIKVGSIRQKKDGTIEVVRKPRDASQARAWSTTKKVRPVKRVRGQ